MRRFAIGFLFLFVVSLVFAQVPGMTPFSGDLTMKMKDGKEVTGKVYMTTGKMRMDMSVCARESTLINDAAAKVGYMVMPQQKMYMQLPTGQMMRGMPKMSDLKAY